MAENSARQAQQKFREVHHLHRRLVEKRVEQTGVFRSQHMTLMFLSEHEGCSQKEIADAYHISNAAVAVNLKKLEKLGFIERIIDSADNRCNCISVTERGRAVVAQSRSIFASIDNRMFCSLTEEELAVFVRCLDKLRDQLLEMDGESGEEKADH